MSNEQGEAIFHAAKLLQLYEETESVEGVTKLAAALLFESPADHLRQIAWFLPPGANPGAPQACCAISTR